MGNWASTEMRIYTVVQEFIASMWGVELGVFGFRHVRLSRSAWVTKGCGTQLSMSCILGLGLYIVLLEACTDCTACGQMAAFFITRVCCCLLL